MTRDVQPIDAADPSTSLLAAARAAVPGWLRRIVVERVSQAGLDPDALGDQLDRLVADETPRLLAALEALLATDVDEQRTNPLSLFREAVSAPTALLRATGVPAPAPDGFLAERFPEDEYRLGPATWSDVDPALHEPGLTWGAWKAMTVLRRRRDEGRR